MDSTKRLAVEVSDVPWSALKKIHVTEYETTFAKNLSCFLKEYHQYDLIFICKKNTVVKAHKTVMAIASEFLKTCILSSGQETCYISLPDVDCNDITAMLDFIYEFSFTVDFEKLCKLKRIFALLKINFPLEKLNNIVRKNAVPASVGVSNRTLQCRSFLKKLGIGPRLETVTSDDPLAVPDMYPEDRDLNGSLDVLPASPSSSENTFIIDNENEESSIIPVPQVTVKQEMRDPGCGPGLSSELHTSQDGASVGKSETNPAQNKALLTAFERNKEKRKYLEQYFLSDQHPSKERYTELQKKLGLSRRYLSDWFSHRRKQEKRKTSRSDFLFTGEGRRVLNDRGIRYLEKIFQQNCSPPGIVYTKLQQKLGVPRKYLMDWFAARRSKEASGNNTPADKNSITGPPRRPFTKKQLQLLEKIYEKNQCPSPAIFDALARKFHVSRKSLTEWFSNRRRKESSAASKTDNEDSDSGSENSAMDYLSKMEKRKLEDIYNKKKYPSKYMCKKLASELDLSEEFIVCWFKKRRAKDTLAVFQETEVVLVTTDPSGNTVKHELTKIQRDGLEFSYSRNKFPSRYIQKKLAAELELPDDLVMDWFRKRRTEDLKAILTKEKVLENRPFRDKRKRCKACSSDEEMDKSDNEEGEAEDDKLSVGGEGECEITVVDPVTKNVDEVTAQIVDPVMCVPVKVEIMEDE